MVKCCCNKILARVAEYHYSPPVHRWKISRNILYPAIMLSVDPSISSWDCKRRNSHVRFRSGLITRMNTRGCSPSMNTDIMAGGGVYIYRIVPTIQWERNDRLSIQVKIVGASSTTSDRIQLFVYYPALDSCRIRSYWSYRVYANAPCRNR